MHPIALQMLCASVVSRFGVHPAAAESALLATLEHFHAEAHSPTVARSGLTPTEYLNESMHTARFSAMLSASALWADGRDIDARLNWKAYVQRETAAAKNAHDAVPPTALLGNPDAIHRIGHRVGLSSEQTDQLIPGIVLTLAAGYPYRSAQQRHMTLTDILAQTTATDLVELLRHAALLAQGRTEAAAAQLRRIMRAAR
ncbi:hypothetical protein K1Y78_26555 [Streptomyces sp. tea 10]|nr:hypothetical protein [Streptomyces sp. tea 10]